MQIQTVAQMLFAGFMAQSLFASDAEIDEHRIKKNPKKDYSGTRRTVFSGPGQYRVNRGTRGKAAVKAARKLTHVKGYYRKLRTGETNGINN